MLSCFPFFVCCVLSVFCVVCFFFLFWGFFSNQEGTLAGASPREKKSGRFFVEEGKPFDQRFFFWVFLSFGSWRFGSGFNDAAFLFLKKK